jgi:hypothetical protein
MPFDHQIKAVALLGATAPARDLGLLHLPTPAKYRYSMSSKSGVIYTPSPKRTSKVDEQKIVDAVIQALEQTEVWRWAKQMIAQGEADDGLDSGEDDGGSYRDEFGDEDYDGQAGDESEQFEEHWDDDGYEDSDMQPLDGHRTPRGRRDPSVDEDAAEFEDEEPVRLGARRQYARPRDDDPCWADDCDPRYAAAARGRPAYKPRMLGSLSKFPKRGRVPDATWSDERDSPSVPVETIAPSWERSSASPWAERRADGSFTMKGAMDACYADAAQTAAVAKAAEEQFRRWQNRRLEGLA